MAALHIVKGKEYKVKDDDTLEKIATEAGLDVKDLAKFNFGTDDPNRINTAMRDKVGCRKKDDNNNFKFSSSDDPGIIYIPEDLPEKLFSDSETHRISLKPIVKKVYKTSKAIVKFRPHDGWKGEFGFDWYRDGDRGKEKYEPPLVTGGDRPPGARLSAIQATEELKKEYNSFKVETKGTPTYYVPWLNIYAETSYKGNSRQPPFEAKLKLKITIEEETAEELKIELPVYTDLDGTEKSYFEIVGSAELPKSVGKYEKEITLKCIKDFKDDQDIIVMLETRKPDGVFSRSMAGKLTAIANTPNRLKSLPIVLIKVWTDVNDTGAPVLGRITSAEVENVYNALYQAHVRAEITADVFDLSLDEDFKKKGKFCKSIGFKQGINTNHKDFFSELTRRFFKIERDNILNRKRYESFTTIFAFDVKGCGDVLGCTEELGSKITVLFAKKDDCTLNHEILHGMNCEHSFNEEGEDKNNYKFTFIKGKTDNIMDYTDDSSALISWKWQWEIINKNGYAEGFIPPFLKKKPNPIPAAIT